MINYSNPFLQSLGNIRTLPQQNQFTQPQNQFNQPQNQYDFSGWGDRLGKIEEGIAGLTKQFNSFQKPGDVAPENTGNAAPEPLEQSANAPEPLGGIESLVAPQDTGFNFDPQGGSLMSQLSSAYGGQTHNEQIGRGPAGFTQGFADFFTGEGYYADPRGTYTDGSWNISDKPIDVGTRGGGVLNPYGYPGSFTGSLAEQFQPLIKPVSQPGKPLIQYQGRPNDIGQPIQQNTGMTPNTGWRPEPGTEGDKGLMIQSVINSLGGRPNDIMQPIGGPTREQQYEQLALQAGLGALQGPTQQKIQQGLGALV